MRKRTGKVGKSILIIYATLAIIFFFILTLTIKDKKSKYYKEKILACEKAKEAFLIVKAYRLNHSFPIDIINDPKETGLIFHPYSIITYERTNLFLTHTSLSPNYAALFVEFLKNKGLKENDSIIIFLDGSFPAMNISLLSALNILKLKPIIFLQVSSISYGANDPNFTFLEILDTLKKAGIFDFTIEYASLGGKNDIGKGLSIKAREFIKEKIALYKIKPLIEENESLQIFKKESLLKSFGNKLIIALSYERPIGESKKIYHFNNPIKLKEEYDIKDELGKGRLFSEKRYSIFLATIFLILLLILLYLIIKYDLEYYLFKKKEEFYEGGI